ncbi:predicted protein [Phaeodactylum tricornutum CCAP 1055/1]|jgi:hypothetical protein|uniref:Uncharacterized protein n=2 Tax=Phaeodactylum tricornutum TaxID=2850 RepID=B7GA59_PHATC|nr:predicted protein [Phaeodactylum tricornutum CCAP 1055/1]EEC44558.1 predicted protein [Phaeodactylum tricornutum CCAP 1055/1]|eukprot:XP_002183889.1 predicted protein [Phaeodactylum tricornutum CCAP 1055/1]
MSLVSTDHKPNYETIENQLDVHEMALEDSVVTVDKEFTPSSTSTSRFFQILCIGAACVGAYGCLYRTLANADLRPHWSSTSANLAPSSVSSLMSVPLEGSAHDKNSTHQQHSAHHHQHSGDHHHSGHDKDSAHHKDSARACTFDECYQTSCDAETAPYTCLFHNGGPHGGCSVTPWTDSTCDDQCDLHDCNDYDVPDSVERCDTPCDESWCTESGGQVCPTNVPYQCMDGSARFGCSTDELQWTLKTDETTCGHCCDATSCY